MGKDLFTPGYQFAQYEIVAPLGEGGMGTVWKALHRGLKKLVVVKALRGDRARNELARERFVREGQAASRVRHPHIVEVFDVGEHEGEPYLVMEYLEGHDLRRHLAQRGALSPEALSDIMVPVCSAVSAAHAAGVIHRDLKPENIFLSRARHRGGLTPKVLDFGVSRIEDDDAQRTATAALLGTPSFMAPEQARGARFADARSDQYSLGVVLYLGATGRLPIDEPSVYEALRRVVHGEFEPPTRARPELAPAFEAVILRAMALDPGARFDSVRALGAALLPFASESTRLVFADADRAPSTTLDDDAPPPVAPAAATSRAVLPAGIVRTRPGRAAVLALVGLAAVAVVAAVASRRTDASAAEPAARAPSQRAAPVVDAPPPTRSPVLPAASVVSHATPAPRGARPVTAPRRPPRTVSRPAPTTRSGLLVD